MNINKKDVVKFSAFPDYLAPDEEKNKKEYGLKMGKAIEYEWFKRKNDSQCSFYDKRDEYHKLRLYARGEQSVDLYKKLLGAEDTTYTNYDFRPLQIVPKFVDLIVNQMAERLFEVRAEAIDNQSTDLKDKYKEYLQGVVDSAPMFKRAKEVLGVDIAPPNIDELPDSREEVDLYMKLKYKPALEIATEEAIKFTLELNNYDEVQTRILMDIVVLGIASFKHYTEPSKGIVIDYVDPANLVYSYPTERNFSDVHYFGEVKRITIEEAKRMANGSLSDDDLKSIAAGSSNWASYHGNETDINYREDDLDNKMVDVLFFTYRTTNTQAFKKKYNKSGGYKMIKKESTFNKPNEKYDGYDAVRNTIDVWYEGTLILGTDYLLKYNLCENMIRPKGYLNRTLPSYVVFAPHLYQNRIKSLVQRIIPYVDQMQQTHIKIQQLIAKARPNGVYIDIDGLEEVDWGDGSVLTPMELVKIYDETGNVIGTSKNAEGDYNHGKMPIVELKNGIIDGVDRLINSYNHYLNLLRDAIGIAQGADASMPHPDTLVGVQQQVALNSNTATRHILNAVLSMTQQLGKGLALRLKDIFKYSNIKEAYISSIGKINTDLLEALKTYHLHDVGIMIELKPDTEEKQFLEANIQVALSNDLITLDDAIDIRKINNIKLANELLKTRRVKRDKAKKAHEENLVKLQTQGQAEAAERAAQAKLMEVQATTEAELQVVNAKTEGKIRELFAEAEAKAKLMEQEFQYNLALRGAETDVSLMKEKYKEDRKDKRQDRNNSQASKLIDQRYTKAPPINFESSEDNISGGIEMGELEPS